MSKYIQFAQDYAPEFTLNQSDYNEIFRSADGGRDAARRGSVATPLFVGGVALWFVALFSIGMIVLG